MTTKETTSGYSGHCIAYTYEGQDLIYARVAYNLDMNAPNYVEETWPGNENPNAHDETVTLLVDPWARKSEVINRLEEMIKKINSEGLYFGSWSHPDQSVQIFDDGEQLRGEPI